MNISELYNLYLQYPKITTDSRSCTKDSLFFALKGDFFDGNTFAEKALQSECSYAIVDDPLLGVHENMILVDDVLATLQELALFHRQTLTIPVIGITGSNGKTTTKELMSAVLSQKYNTLCTQGNLNNHIGVPLTLLSINSSHEVAVIEMGANHPGEIEFLTQLVRPEYGLITNVGHAHLEGFGSFEGVIKTKGELYDFIRKTKGKIFIHQDNRYLRKIAEGIDKITYGGNDFETGKHEPFVAGAVLSRHPFLSFRWQAKNTESHTINTKLVGDYNLWNALAAVAAGLYLKVLPEQINNAIENYEPVNNRSQLMKTENNELIIDAYNANPSSMVAALKNFASSESPRKALILGDMHELGEKSIELHAEIIERITMYDFEKVFLCGKIFSTIAGQYPCFLSVEELNSYFKVNPMKGYCILIKGSHEIHLEKTISSL